MYFRYNLPNFGKLSKFYHFFFHQPKLTVNLNHLRIIASINIQLEYPRVNQYFRHYSQAFNVSLIFTK